MLAELFSNSFLQILIVLAAVVGLFVYMSRTLTLRPAVNGTSDTATMSKTIKDLQAENGRLADEIKRLEISIDTVLRENNRLRTEVGELRVNLTQAEGEIQALRSDLSMYKLAMSNTSMGSRSTTDMTNLRTVLEQRFSEDELRSLAFDLNIDYGALGWDTKNANARELISWCERHEVMDALIARVRELRPKVRI